VCGFVILVWCGFVVDWFGGGFLFCVWVFWFIGILVCCFLFLCFGCWSGLLGFVVFVSGCCVFLGFWFLVLFCFFLLFLVFCVAFFIGGESLFCGCLLVFFLCCLLRCLGLMLFFCGLWGFWRCISAWQCVLLLVCR